MIAVEGKTLREWRFVWLSVSYSSALVEYTCTVQWPRWPLTFWLSSTWLH